MEKHFSPVRGYEQNIIEWVLSRDGMPTDPSLLFKIRLCVEEAVVNVASYAYGNSDGFLDVAVSISDDMLVINLKDAGVPFNPLQMKDPDITLSAGEREIGGLGILLCKKIMDSVEYEYVEGCNSLTMKLKK